MYDFPYTADLHGRQLKDDGYPTGEWVNWIRRVRRRDFVIVGETIRFEIGEDLESFLALFPILRAAS